MGTNCVLLYINTKVHVYQDTNLLNNYICNEILPVCEQSKLMIQLFLISTDEEYIAKIQSTLDTLLLCLKNQP